MKVRKKTSALSLDFIKTSESTHQPIGRNDSVVEAEQDQLIGKEVKIFQDAFAPEAIGVVEAVRGFGTLQVVEVRIHPNQPRTRVRIAAHRKWELFRGGES